MLCIEPDKHHSTTLKVQVLIELLKSSETCGSFSSSTQRSLKPGHKLNPLFIIRAPEGLNTRGKEVSRGLLVFNRSAKAATGLDGKKDFGDELFLRIFKGRAFNGRSLTLRGNSVIDLKETDYLATIVR